MKKIDRIIQVIKEMMVGNAAGSQGGFGASADSSGPVAGYDKFVGTTGRVDYRRVPKTYKKWVKYLENK